MIAALTTQMMFQAFNAIVRTSTRYAAIAISYECTFKEYVRIVIEQVMHDAVAKVGSKHFAHLGVVDDEAGRGARPIGVAIQFVAQFREVCLQVVFKLQLIILMPLVPPCILVGTVEVEQQLFARESHVLRICLDFTINSFFVILFCLFEVLFGIFTLFVLANRPPFAASKQCQSAQKHLSTKLEIKSKQILKEEDESGGVSAETGRTVNPLLRLLLFQS